jgi:hypothetical protein
VALNHFGANHFAADHFLSLWRGVPDLSITDTDILHKPVDYVLAGQQPIKDRYREWNVPQAKRTERTTVTRSGPRRLGGGTGFTVRTDKRGYD